MRPPLLILAFMASLAVFAVSPSLAEPLRQPHPLITDQDPLMRQIMRRHLREANGGITAVVRVATGQSIELQLVELGTMSVLGPGALARPAGGTIQKLNPAEGLLPRKEKPAPKKRKVTKAAEQLKALKRQGEKQSW